MHHNRSPGNLHPSVVNRTEYGKAAPLLGGGSVLGVEEAEARARAREILQDFLRHKSRAEEVEGQLQRAMLENERLNHLIHEVRTEAALGRERSARDLDALRAEKLEFENRVSTAQDEVRKVAQSFAQRASDGAAQLRLKEQEVQQLEAQLRAAKEEAKTLRSTASRNQNGLSAEEIQRGQERVVELARKCLELERTKAKLEQDIIEDRKHSQQALRTIEGLRKQLMEAEAKINAVEAEKGAAEKRHEAAMQALHREMDMQRELYRGFVAQLSGGGPGTGSGKSGTAHGERSVETELAVAQQRCLHLTERVEGLENQLQLVSAEHHSCAQALQSERTQHLESLSTMQIEIHTLTHEVDLLNRKVAEAKDDSRHSSDAYNQLQAVHEALKSDFSTQAHEVSRAVHHLEEVQRTHERLVQQIADLKQQVSARESACERLAAALSARKPLEEEIRELKLKHKHDLELQRMQHLSALKLSGDSNNGRAPVAATAYLAAAQLLDSRDGGETLGRVSALEQEKQGWLRERERLLDDQRRDRDTAQQEIGSLQRALEEARIEAAERRSEAVYALKEAAEWRSAFGTSEKTRSQLQQQVDELREEIFAAHRGKANVELQQSMFKDQTQRLETQVDRDRDEIFRLRRIAGNLEVNLTRKELEFAAFRFSVQQHALSDATASGRPTNDIQKDLLSLRLAKEQLEDTLRDKEVALQKLHQDHLRAVAGSRAQSSASAPEPTTLAPAPPPHRVSPAPQQHLPHRGTMSPKEIGLSVEQHSATRAAAAATPIAKAQVPSRSPSESSQQRDRGARSVSPSHPASRSPVPASRSPGRRSVSPSALPH